MEFIEIGDIVRISALGLALLSKWQRERWMGMRAVVKGFNGNHVHIKSPELNEEIVIHRADLIKVEL